MPLAYCPTGGVYYCHPSTNDQMWWKIWSLSAVPCPTSSERKTVQYVMDQKQILLCSMLFCLGLPILLNRLRSLGKS